MWSTKSSTTCLVVALVVTTLALGSQPRQGVARLQAKRKTQKSHHMLLKVQRMWGNEPSHSQVNSNVRNWSPKWTFESSEHNCRGQNSSPWKVLYIIRKLLKHTCLKLVVWLPTIKHLESTRFPCVKATCNIPLESSWQGLQLCFKPHCNWRYA